MKNLPQSYYQNRSGGKRGGSYASRMSLRERECQEAGWAEVKGLRPGADQATQTHSGDRQTPCCEGQGQGQAPGSPAPRTLLRGWPFNAADRDAENQKRPISTAALSGSRTSGWMQGVKINIKYQKDFGILRYHSS